MCVPEILQMCVAVRGMTLAGDGPYCECLFFLMTHEPADGEASVCSPFGLCDNMQGLGFMGSRLRSATAGLRGVLGALSLKNQYKRMRRLCTVLLPLLRRS